MKKITISNWRSIKNVEFDARKLMVFIGQNNHGKSNLLSAILFFFGEIKHLELDFHLEAEELYVEIEFANLTEEDKNTFKKYVNLDGNIIVRKTAYIAGNFEYRGKIEIPKNEYLQEVNADHYTKREDAKNQPFYKYLPENGRLSKKSIIEAQTKYITENRSSIEFNYELETNPFLGLKSVAKGIFGEIYFLPAVKNTSEDFNSKDSSPFGKIYADIITTISEQNSDWKDTKEKLTMLFHTLNKKDSSGTLNPNRPQQLNKLESEIARELNALSWNTDIEIAVTPPNIENVFKANTQIWINDGVRTDIQRKGHGLQRALIIALIRVVAARVNNNSSAAESNRQASQSRYFIFEEPELYLHPQAQRELFDSLISLSEADNQIILCTHSSFLIDVERYKSIYIVTKENQETGTKIKSCDKDVLLEDSKKEFNLAYWINPDRGELFFADKVLLVEGQTDKIIIPYLAKKLEIFKYGYTILDCGSKDNIPTYINLLNNFEIPYVVIFDEDHQEHKGCDGITSADKSTNKILDSIKSELGEYVIFENDIEEELGLNEKKSKNKPYDALQHASSDTFTIPPSLENKLRIIYA